MSDRGLVDARAATHAVLLARCGVALCGAGAPRRPRAKGLALLVLHARLEAGIGVPNGNVGGSGDGSGDGTDTRTHRHTHTLTSTNMVFRFFSWSSDWIIADCTTG